MFPRSPGIWFFSDDFGVSANVGYQGFDGSRNTNCGVGASWRFTGSPFTLNAGYENYGGDADLAAWGVGLTWNFGADSVRAESQSAAGWDGARRTYQDLLGGFQHPPAKNKRHPGLYRGVSFLLRVENVQFPRISTGAVHLRVLESPSP